VAADLVLTAYDASNIVDAEHCRPHWLIDGGAYWPTREEAEAAIARYNAAVVESSPEVAALRARVAELTLERDGLSEMVAELEAERTPKVRDESVPPPGWVESDRGPGYAYCPDVLTSLAAAWRIYDAEHGYAPDRITELESMLREANAARPIWDQIDALAERVADGAAASESRIRADERAKCQAEQVLREEAIATLVRAWTERDIAAWLDKAAESAVTDAKFQALDVAADYVRASDYPKLPR
jgi:hypothetical protein